MSGLLSDSIYTVDLPEKQCRAIIFYVNLMKTYHQCPEYVNLIVQGGCEEIEDEACIPYSVADPNHFDLNKLIKKKAN